MQRERDGICTYDGKQIAVAQSKRDKALKDLLNIIKNAYDLSVRSQQIRQADTSMKKLLKEMSVQTVECAYFIRDQFSDASFRTCARISDGDAFNFIAS